MPIAQGLAFRLLAPPERCQVLRFRPVIVLAFPAVNFLYGSGIIPPVPSKHTSNINHLL
jgi:hypothetical protein